MSPATASTPANTGGISQGESRDGSRGTPRYGAHDPDAEEDHDQPGVRSKREADKGADEDDAREDRDLDRASDGPRRRRGDRRQGARRRDGTRAGELIPRGAQDLDHVVLDEILGHSGDGCLLECGDRRHAVTRSCD